MNINELYSLAGSIDTPLITPEIHTPNDFYGHATILKHYAQLPQNYAIKAVIEHAAVFSSFFWDVELNARLPVFLCPAFQRVTFLSTKTNKALFDVGPLILYAPNYLSDDEIEKEKKKWVKIYWRFLVTLRIMSM